MSASRQELATASAGGWQALQAMDQRRFSGLKRTMKKGTKINRMIILLAVSLLQMSIAALLLNNFTMEGWSVTHAEDSEGYLLGVRYFSGEDIPPVFSFPLKIPAVQPGAPFSSSSSRPGYACAYTFLVVNMLLWLLSVYLCYRCRKPFSTKD